VPTEIMVRVLRIHSLSLWERAGVRAASRHLAIAQTLTPTLSRKRERE